MTVLHRPCAFSSNNLSRDTCCTSLVWQRPEGQGLARGSASNNDHKAWVEEVAHAVCEITLPSAVFFNWASS